MITASIILAKDLNFFDSFIKNNDSVVKGSQIIVYAFNPNTILHKYLQM